MAGNEDDEAASRVASHLRATADKACLVGPKEVLSVSYLCRLSESQGEQGPGNGGRQGSEWKTSTAGREIVTRETIFAGYYEKGIQSDKGGPRN